ncbi:MAG: flagellar protein FliT [Dehalococcoidales bacterium]|nr:flagellar protein FliT [Dehalococcoidales bacterium]
MKTEATSEELDRVMRTCDELLQLSLAQCDAIAADDVDLLNRLIEQREGLISSLDLKAVDFNWSGFQAGANAGLTAKRSLVLEKLRELLRIDTENREALETRAAEVRAQLATVTRGRHALHQYAYINPQAEPIYLDKRT